MITDGFHSGSTENMFALFDEMKAQGVRVIALGFFGEFAFYSPNLFLMTNEVYHVSNIVKLVNLFQTMLQAANYTELLALDNTIFQTVCEDGTIHAESVTVSKQITGVTREELVLLQAAHDWYEVYAAFPVWLPEEWRP